MPSDRTVCHVTSVHIPLDSRILYHECRSSAMRWRTVLVCRDHDGAREVEGVEIRPIPKARGRIARLLTVNAVVEAAERVGADLYHFHDPELLPAMADLAARTRKPVIYDAHEHYPDAMDQKSWIPVSLRPAAARWADSVERKRVPSMAAIITADVALEQRFSEMHPRVVRLDNYPPLALFGEPHSRTSTSPVLLYVGSVSAVRGFFDMIDVIRRVRLEHQGAKLVVYGRPAEDVASRLHETLASLPSDAVEMRGPVPYGDLPAVLADATVGLSLLKPHPKYEKNVSMKVFDYMAAGLPYVASDFAPLAEATGGAGGILVPPGDSKAAAGAVLDLLRHPAQLREKSQEGRRVIERGLSWETVEPRLIALYEDLLGE